MLKLSDAVTCLTNPLLHTILPQGRTAWAVELYLQIFSNQKGEVEEFQLFPLDKEVEKFSFAPAGQPQAFAASRPKQLGRGTWSGSPREDGMFLNSSFQLIHISSTSRKQDFISFLHQVTPTNTADQHPCHHCCHTGVPIPLHNSTSRSFTGVHNLTLQKVLPHAHT